MRRLLRLTGVFVFSKTDKNILRILKISTDEFFKWIEHELDYRLEALNITRIKNNLAELEFFEAPEVLHPFSTKLILTMDYIDGVSLNTLINFIPDLPYTPTIKYKNINCNKAVLIKEFVEVVFHQVFKDGYFHADPHPANILLTPKNHIAFIDFGIVGALQPHFRETLTTILTGMVERDVKKVSRAFIDFNQSGSTIEMSKVERGVSSVLDDWQTGSVIEMTMAEVFYRLLIVAQEAKIEVPLSVFILGKTVLEYDGLLRKFDPGMDILESLKSYVAGEGTLFGLKEIPIAIEDVLKHPENLPADVLKLTEQLAKDGVEFVSHFLPSVR
jgi:ubiquinone biosynthesis protein